MIDKKRDIEQEGEEYVPEIQKDLTDPEEEGSDFGKGLIVCLVKFAEHFMQINETMRLYEKMREDSPNKDLFTESSACEIWANGASDHLYEIEVPEGEDWDEIREKVALLQDRGLTMGHGFNRPRGSATIDQVKDLMKLTREIATLIDEKIGLEPDLGRW